MATPALAATRPLVRVGIAVMAFFLLSMSASGARMAIPGLRQQTRMVVLNRSMRPSRTRRPVARAFFSGRRKLAALVRALPAPRFLSPRAWLAPMPAPAARPDGQDAVGVSVPKGRKWAVVGGHGRLGPGASS